MGILYPWDSGHQGGHGIYDNDTRTAPLFLIGLTPNHFRI